MADRLPLYQTLQQLPLFQGMGSEDMAQIISQTKFMFRKFEKGNWLIRQDEKCNELIILLHGSVCQIRENQNHHYSFTEYPEAPMILMPESLFGLYQYFPSSILCNTDCHVVSISKEGVYQLLEQYFIFRLNWINNLSYRLQKEVLWNWKIPPINLRQRIARFIVSHCNHPAGKVIVKISMHELALLLNDRRANISQVLHEFQEEKLLKLGRAKLIIPAIELFVHI